MRAPAHHQKVNIKWIFSVRLCPSLPPFLLSLSQQFLKKSKSESIQVPTHTIVIISFSLSLGSLDGKFHDHLVFRCWSISSNAEKRGWESERTYCATAVTFDVYIEWVVAWLLLKYSRVASGSKRTESASLWETEACDFSVEKKCGKERTG